jgi:hypothetical protein
MGFKAKHEPQLEKMRLGFRVYATFTLLSNAWLWVLQEPYPNSVNVKWISNLISNSSIFYTLFKFLGCLKIYYSGRHQNNVNLSLMGKKSLSIWITSRTRKLFVNNNNVWGWSIVIEMLYGWWKEGRAFVTWKVWWWGIVIWKRHQIELNGRYLASHICNLCYQCSNSY